MFREICIIRANGHDSPSPSNCNYLAVKFHFLPRRFGNSSPFVTLSAGYVLD